MSHICIHSIHVEIIWVSLKLHFSPLQRRTTSIQTMKPCKPIVSHSANIQNGACALCLSWTYLKSNEKTILIGSLSLPNWTTVTCTLVVTLLSTLFCHFLCQGTCIQSFHDNYHTIGPAQHIKNATGCSLVADAVRTRRVEKRPWQGKTAAQQGKLSSRCSYTGSNLWNN